MNRSLRQVLPLVAVLGCCSLFGCGGGGGGGGGGGTTIQPPVLSQPSINPTTVDFVGGTVTLSVEVSGTLSAVSMRADIRRQSDGQTFVKTNSDFTRPASQTSGTFGTTFNAPSNSGSSTQVYQVTFTASDVDSTNPRFNPATLTVNQTINVIAPQNPGGSGGPGLPFP